MFKRFFKLARLAVLPILILSQAGTLSAAQYGAVVMDARDGTVIYSQNGTTRLHPASLTKMMTLYIAFAEIDAGRLSLETNVLISKNVASKPSSKIGLRAGTTMKVKYLLRAAAVKSANDAATALAEAIGGSEAGFAQYMNQTAAALGMRNSHFSNPHGLSSSNNYSTPMDMAILARHVVYDYPRFFQLFSQEGSDTPLGSFQSTNVRFLRDYPGADGIKTGFTNAAGYNLVGTAKRADKRVIVSMFGGQSSFQRNEQVGALLDLGFQKAASNVQLANISRPRLSGMNVAVAQVEPEVVEVAPVVENVPVEQPKPAVNVSTEQNNSGIEITSNVDSATENDTNTAQPDGNDDGIEVTSNVDAQMILNSLDKPVDEAKPNVTTGTKFAPQSALKPAKRDAGGLKKDVEVATLAATAEVKPEGEADKAEAIDTPPSRAEADKVDETKTASAENSAGDYAIQTGTFATKAEAQDFVIKAASMAVDALGDAKHSVFKAGESKYRARFSGLSKKDAYGACKKIEQSNKCYVIAPS